MTFPAALDQGPIVSSKPLLILRGWLSATIASELKITSWDKRGSADGCGKVGRTAGTIRDP
jgi:hypothetical protein